MSILPAEPLATPSSHIRCRRLMSSWRNSRFNCQSRTASRTISLVVAYSPELTAAFERGDLLVGKRHAHFLDRCHVMSSFWEQILLLFIRRRSTDPIRTVRGAGCVFDDCSPRRADFFAPTIALRNRLRFGQDPTADGPPKRAVRSGEIRLIQLRCRRVSALCGLRQPNKLLRRDRKPSSRFSARLPGASGDSRPTD